MLALVLKAVTELFSEKKSYFFEMCKKERCYGEQSFL